MKDIFEWKRLLFNDLPATFLLEVFFRSFVMFAVLLVGLRSSGKRGVKQLSVFELVLIIALGSAAGDPMFYEDVGIIPAIAVFVVVIFLYRLVTWLAAKSPKMEALVEGRPEYLIRNGRFAIEELKKEDLAQDEFFAELRVNNVAHLGQIRCALIETSGVISILYFRDEDVKPGLPLWPEQYDRRAKMTREKGLHACTYCGNVEEIGAGQEHTCGVCKRGEWVKAINGPRIT
ncbi:MAG: DUF421 domain-containing protein [Mucilaginibacter polytrichastri]|nr:DUF421 domain-containing protein [Mucilaginibacter polytrichastri]